MVDYTVKVVNVNLVAVAVTVFVVVIVVVVVWYMNSTSKKADPVAFWFQRHWCVPLKNLALNIVVLFDTDILYC